MPPPSDQIRRLEQRARELRRGWPVAPETQPHDERIAQGMRATGDVIQWMRTGERLAEGTPVERTGSGLVEELRFARFR